MSSDSLRKEIRRLLAEAAAEREADPLGAYPDWPLDSQLDQVELKLRWYAAFESGNENRYPATDREIHVLGIWCAIRELASSPYAYAEDRDEFVYEYTFDRSGLTITFETSAARDELSVSAPRKITLADVPTWLLDHFERMAPEEQPERDHYLYGRRHDARADLEELRQMQARASER